MLLHLDKVSKSIVEARFASGYKNLHCFELFPPKKPGTCLLEIHFLTGILVSCVPI